MKTKLFLVALSAICFATVSQAQQKFNVQNKTKTEFYDDLETAISKAVAGDTIYLPGKVIQVQKDLIIDKKLALIGAGCDVDSIGGLQTTEIKKADGSYATINFRNGSDGSLLMGCIVGTIQFGHQDEFYVAQQDIKNVIIWRNKINRIYLGLSSTNNLIKQIIISENIINNNISGNYASDCIINNNLCLGYSVYMSGAYNYEGSIYGFKSSHINNNVLQYNIISLRECVVENNFFASGTVTPVTYSYGDNYNNLNSSFNNNAFTTNFTFPVGTNTGSNNLMSQEAIRTFQVNDLNFPKNLKIRSDSPCKNAGTDGTDIGIYGGSQPYKDGAVPFNPHINKAVIAGQTDKDGKLKVNIKVSAQTR